MSAAIGREFPPLSLNRSGDPAWSLQFLDGDSVPGSQNGKQGFSETLSPGLVSRAATVSVLGPRGPGSTSAPGSPWESQLWGTAPLEGGSAGGVGSTLCVI